MLFRSLQAKRQGFNSLQKQKRRKGRDRGPGIPQKDCADVGHKGGRTIGKDLETGQVFAEEYGSQCRGQMTLDDYQGQRDQVVDGKTVDTETGEIREESRVIDLREAKQA